MESNLGYSNLLIFLLVASTSLILLSELAFAATAKLSSQEVTALKEIGKKLGKKEWDFGVDPCSGKGNWNVSDEEGIESSVVCDCSYNNNSSCHVVRMYYTTLSASPSPFSLQVSGSNPIP